MYHKSKREDELFSGTKQKKDKKKQQKDKDTPSTLPDATSVHRCLFDHSQRFMLVVMSKGLHIRKIYCM